MQKTRLLLLWLLPVFSASATHSSVLRWSDGEILPGSPSPPLRTVERVGEYTEVTYEFPEFGVEADTVFDGAYTVRMPTFFPFSSPGEPACLGRIDVLNVADPSAVTVEIVEAVYTDFPMTLAPARQPEMMGEDVAAEVLPIAPYTGFMPAAPVDGFDRFIHRGQGGIKIAVSPVLYSTETSTTRLYSRIRYRVLSSDGSGSEPLSSAPYALYSENEESLEFDINHPYVATDRTTHSPDDGRVPYLIIAHSMYSTCLLPFIEWKKTLGMDVQAVYSDSWTVQGVKTTIATRRAGDPKLKYVLFVGNHSQVPGATTEKDINPNEGDTTQIFAPSDHEYTVTSKSGFPELLRGRLSVNNVSSLTTVINKIISYEKDPVTDDDFYKRAVHLSYLETELGSTTKDGSCFVAASEEVRHYVLKGNPINIQRLYSGPLGNKITHWGRFYGNSIIPDSLNYNKVFWNKGGDDFIDAINDGVFYALYIGHGAYNKFRNLTDWNIDNRGDVDREKIASLKNGAKLPIIFAMSCQTANFAQENVANLFMSKKGGGCVGYFGATHSIYIENCLGLPMVAVNAMWNHGAFETSIANPPYILYSLQPDHTLRTGEVLAIMIYNLMNHTSHYCPIPEPHRLHYIGDPSMYMRLQKPIQIKDATAEFRDGKICVNLLKGIPRNIAFYDTSTDETRCYLSSYAEFETANPGSVKICVYDAVTIPWQWQYSPEGSKTVSDSSIDMEVSNSPGYAVHVKILADEYNLQGTEISVAGINRPLSLRQTLDADVREAEIPVGETGVYAVTLLSGENVLQTKKIIVNQ